MAEASDAEKRAKRLLGWATVLVMIALAVCALDMMIKNAILDQARDSQRWIDRLREDVKASDRTSDQDTGEPGEPGDDRVGMLGNPDTGARAEADTDARM